MWFRKIGPFSYTYTWEILEYIYSSPCICFINENRWKTLCLHEWFIEALHWMLFIVIQFWFGFWKVKFSPVLKQVHIWRKTRRIYYFTKNWELREEGIHVLKKHNALNLEYFGILHLFHENVFLWLKITSINLITNHIEDYFILIIYIDIEK